MLGASGPRRRLRGTLEVRTGDSDFLHLAAACLNGDLLVVILDPLASFPNENRFS